MSLEDFVKHMGSSDPFPTSTTDPHQQHMLDGRLQTVYCDDGHLYVIRDGQRVYLTRAQEDQIDC